ncbi:MAG: hypothetical protein EOO41_05725, partial [Methanobacteriota archaeon]
MHELSSAQGAIFNARSDARRFLLPDDVAVCLRSLSASPGIVDVLQRVLLNSPAGVALQSVPAAVEALAPLHLGPILNAHALRFAPLLCCAARACPVDPPTSRSTLGASRFRFQSDVASVAGSTSSWADQSFDEVQFNNAASDAVSLPSEADSLASGVHDRGRGRLPRALGSVASTPSSLDTPRSPHSHANAGASSVKVSLASVTTVAARTAAPSTLPPAHVALKHAARRASSLERTAEGGVASVAAALPAPVDRSPVLLALPPEAVTRSASGSTSPAFHSPSYVGSGPAQRQLPALRSPTWFPPTDTLSSPPGTKAAGAGAHASLKPNPSAPPTMVAA